MQEKEEKEDQKQGRGVRRSARNRQDNGEVKLLIFHILKWLKIRIYILSNYIRFAFARIADRRRISRERT